MSVETRRQRERRDRHRLIVDTARRIAEAEGWDAVTTRRLAADIEYSQPVLYSHFSGKTAIMAAVAAQGAAELVNAIETAVKDVDRSMCVDVVSRAYLGYATAHRAVYEAIFSTEAGDGAAHTIRVREVLDASVAEHGEVALALWPLLHGIASLTSSRHIDYTDSDHARAVASLLPGGTLRTARLIAGGKLTRVRERTTAS